MAYLIWHDDHRLPALIDWDDPVVDPRSGAPGQVRSAGAPPASSPRAQGRRPEGDRYVVQLVLAGVPYHKPKHAAGTTPSAWTWVPASIAIVPREGRGPARAAVCGAASRCASHPPPAAPHGAAEACRQSGALRRAGSAQEARQRGSQVEAEPRLPGQQAAQGGPRAQAGSPPQEPAWAAGPPDRGRGPHHHHREVSYKGWQKRYGKSVGLRAPGMLIAHLKRTVASTGGTLHEFPTRSTKLSQYCHGCEVTSSQSRSRSAGTSARAASGRCSVTCTPRFWLPISIQQIPSPRVPGT